jgi:hypothetical protein
MGAMHTPVHDLAFDMTGLMVACTLAKVHICFLEGGKTESFFLFIIIIATDHNSYILHQEHSRQPCSPRKDNTSSHWAWHAPKSERINS